MATLVFRNGPYAGKTLQIPPGKTITVGRNRDIELPLPDLKLSRRHCQIQATSRGYVVRDLGSTNGTFLNGKKLDSEASLHHFDRLHFGDTEIEFQCPENIEDQQTRVDMPAPAPQVAPGSLALELSTEDFQQDEPPAGALQGWIAPPTQPMPAPPGSTEVIGGFLTPETNDPLRLALRELDLPLPPEPPQEQQAPAAAAPQLLFCDACNGSIPVLEMDLNLAKEIGGKLYCRECLARGVKVGEAAAARPPAASGGGQDIEDILKGLADVEEITVDELPGSRGRGKTAAPGVRAPGPSQPRAAPRADVAAGSTRRLPIQPPAQPARPVPPPAPVSQAEIAEMLGDDFEEIGAPLGALAPAPAAKTAPRAPGPAKGGLPPKKAPPKDEDEDLIEIGSSGPA